MVVDEAKFKAGPGVVQALVRDCHARRGMFLPREQRNEVLFYETKDDGTVETVGAWVACDCTEYEFGKLMPNPYIGFVKAYTSWPFG